MTSGTRLIGSELIDCARANSSKGVTVAASRCGYGDDIAAFEAALGQAGDHIGIEINGFESLVKSSGDRQSSGIDVGPDTPDQL